MTNWIAISISVSALIISTCVATWGWWRHRNIYDIEHVIYNRGRGAKNEEIREKLNSGKYTVLNVTEDRRYLWVIIGRIKR